MTEPSFNTSALIEESIKSAKSHIGAKLVLAYSGGVDSEVLAQGLSSYAKSHPEFRYLLVHVHHGLSSNADAWVTHCQKQASDYQLPIEVVQVQVETGPRLSIEAEARRARYKAITSFMDTGDVLLTAHHLDDQLETVLLALKRGLGPKGLSAMGTLQVFDGDKQLLRPLLSVSREQIEAKASSLSLPHIEDESNTDDKYDRNFLRLQIIPKLKSRWSAIATTASRSAALCAQQQAVIDDEVSARLPNFIEQVPHGEGTALNLELLGHQTPNWQALLLRGYIESSGFAPVSQVQLEQLLSQLLTAKPDANLEVRIADMLVRRFREKAYLSSFRQESYKPRTLSTVELRLERDIHLIQEINIPLSPNIRVEVIEADGEERVRQPSIEEKVSVRFSAVGSMRCHPHNRQKGRELKKLWQEYGVPPWERERVPLIFYNEKLVCAVGYWVEHSFQSAEHETGLRFSVAI
ncbi:tRNA lysidine(34) synthetase TilS [Shewanella nanhaiensis]|uniref:tRNA(Ile)-lysidine synthase n=1 Tax=Shewanella nanhaiensis TaxID=2864872 RepID=A0ABS7DYE9_9GAMM|nr:tRNA lysidine(34) synthetase TilS [Shewanella nanhaiensis]MBW8182456.1 tRNA lysidine(34) synthetase TilS [Shewanella nanhaiensis]